VNYPSEMCVRIVGAPYRLALIKCMDAEYFAALAASLNIMLQS
jgi:hypothetical protein